MAGKSKTEVRVGGGKSVGGYGFRAPLGTTRPADATSAPDAAYIDQGFFGDDGLSIKTDNGVDKIKDWNLDTIATIQKQNEATLEVTFRQISSPEQAKTIFGEANVTVASGGIANIAYTGEVLPHFQWAFLLEDSNGVGVLDIGDGQLTGIDGIEFKKDSTVDVKATIELFKDDAGVFFNWRQGVAAASGSGE